MMRNLFVFVCAFVFGCVLTSCCSAAELGKVVPPAAFDVSGLPLGEVVALYYKEAYTRPYVICSDVLADVRPVALRAEGKSLDGPGMAALLDVYGFQASDKGGVTVVCKKVEAKEEQVLRGEPLLYRVKFRDSGYLVDLVSPMFDGKFANRRGSLALAVGGAQPGTPGPISSSGQPLAPNQIGRPPSGAASSPVSSSLNASLGDDYLVFTGSEVEKKRLLSLLVQLDTPVGEVTVKAYMYEVGKSASDGSALQLVVKALGGRVSGSVGPVDALSNLVRLHTGSVDLVASALASDARFKVVSAPFVRVRSGKTARFVSGGAQSILGSIVTNANGSTQQSFSQVDSGTILEVSPVVRGDVVDVDLFQQVSSFVESPGASAGQPPTLNKREVHTALSMTDGEVIVLGGLDDRKEDASSTGLRFLPFALGKSVSGSNSELVLVLELKRL